MASGCETLEIGLHTVRYTSLAGTNATLGIRRKQRKGLTSRTVLEPVLTHFPTDQFRHNLPCTLIDLFTVHPVWSFHNHIEEFVCFVSPLPAANDLDVELHVTTGRQHCFAVNNLLYLFLHCYSTVVSLNASQMGSRCEPRESLTDALTEARYGALSQKKSNVAASKRVMPMRMFSCLHD